MRHLVILLSGLFCLVAGPSLAVTQVASGGFVAYPVPQMARKLPPGGGMAPPTPSEGFKPLGQQGGNFLPLPRKAARSNTTAPAANDVAKAALASDLSRQRAQQLLSIFAAHE